MAVITLTKENLQEVVLDSKLPVLLDFGGPNCGYCRRIAPAVAAVAEENEGRLVVCTVNVDEEPEITERFDIMTIPELVVVKNGERGESVVNPGSKAEIEAYLREQGAL